jgi:hypothetical protein
MELEQGHGRRRPVCGRGVNRSQRRGHGLFPGQDRDARLRADRLDEFVDGRDEDVVRE